MYYSKQFTCDKEKFKQHKFGHWAFLAAQAGAVPLKMTFAFEQFSMESTTVEVAPSEIDNQIFIIDAKTSLKEGMP